MLTQVPFKMKRYNDYVHYIWVGSNDIPQNFINNFNATKKLNSTYNFVLWRDSEIKALLPEDYLKKYDNLSIFHKLQMGRYNVAEKYGGIVCDFDIVWKKDFDEFYDWVGYPTEMVFPYRNSIHFYDKGKKTTLVDDFVFFSVSGKTLDFLRYCDKHNDLRTEAQESPYSVWNLTEWLLGQENVKYFSPKLIDDKANSLLAVHDNKKTWMVDNYTIL